MSQPASISSSSLYSRRSDNVNLFGGAGRRWVVVDFFCDGSGGSGNIVLGGGGFGSDVLLVMIGDGLCLGSGGGGGCYHITDVSGLGIYVQYDPVLGVYVSFVSDGF